MGSLLDQRLSLTFRRGAKLVFGRGYVPIEYQAGGQDSQAHQSRFHAAGRYHRFGLEKSVRVQFLSYLRLRITGMIRKTCAIVTPYRAAVSRTMFLVVAMSVFASGQDAAKYPIAIAVDQDAAAYVVDLDLPGVWKLSGVDEPLAKASLFVRGSNLLRQPLNRPRCIAIDAGGAILVGDSATRDVYRIALADAEPVPLTGGQIGVPMAICVDGAGEFVYVGDAEKRSTFKFPIAGGKPELVARVNARGLAFDDQQNLWAVTPDDPAVVTIDVKTGDVKPIVTGRPFGYPNGLAWSGGSAFVTDGYARAIHQVTAQGKTTIVHQGDGLIGPVGIVADEANITVVDPKTKRVIRFARP